MIAALLLGRKGSIGFPGKNTFRVLGRPMASYPMRAAHQATLVDTGYLSTDDPELMALARTEGFEVIERPPELCTPAALGEDGPFGGTPMERTVFPSPRCDRSGHQGTSLVRFVGRWCESL